MRLFALIALAAMLPAVTYTAAFADGLRGLTVIKNTDFTTAGLGGIRGVGTGTISVAGVSGRVTKALLYWAGPTNSSDPSVNANIVFQSTPIVGRNIGISHDNCWQFANSQAYRADVTALVSGNGNYSISSLIKDNADINGASLIIFFDDGDKKNDRDFIIIDGNDSNIANAVDADGWSVMVSGINYKSGAVVLQLHVSDGQAYDDDPLKRVESYRSGGWPTFPADLLSHPSQKARRMGHPHYI